MTKSLHGTSEAPPSASRMRRAFTVVELMVVAAIFVVVMAAVTQAYITGVDLEKKMRTNRDKTSVARDFADRMTDFIRHAYLWGDSADTASFFIGSQGIPTSTANSAGNDLTQAGADTLTFTIAGTRIPTAVTESEDDFEQNNQRFGPQGGVEEVGISMTAVGDPGTRTGLFLREQRPADGDPSQGGNETLFADNVTSIQFEFFDGEDWQPDWDTRTQGTKRLPSAVRVTYRFEGDETDRILVIRVPASDATPDNPVSEGS